MRKSSAITLVVLGGIMLSGCLCAGIGGKSHKYYDKAGNVVPRERWKNPDGTAAELYDEQGNPVASDQVLSAYSSTTSSRSSSSGHYRSGGFWGPSFFHSSGSSWGSSSSGASRPSSGNVTRGGFGSSGSHSSGGSSSS